MNLVWKSTPSILGAFHLFVRSFVLETQPVGMANVTKSEIIKNLASSSLSVVVIYDERFYTKQKEMLVFLL